MVYRAVNMRQTRRLWLLVQSPDSQTVLPATCYQWGSHEEYCHHSANCTQVIRDAKLRYFGHVAQSDSAEDHCRTISVALKIRLNQEWKRPPGRQTATWLRTVEKDLAPLHLGLHTAWRCSDPRYLKLHDHNMNLRFVWMHAIDDNGELMMTLTSAQLPWHGNSTRSFERCIGTAKIKWTFEVKALFSKVIV